MEMIEVDKSDVTKKDDNPYLIAEAKLNPIGGGVYPGLYHQLVQVLKEISFIRFPQRKSYESSTKKDDQLKSYGCQ